METEAPVGENGITYQSPDWSEGRKLSDNSDFVFYYTYSGYDEAKYGKKPTGIEITNVPTANALNIKNSQYISISAEKSFSGTNIPENSKVELELLWSLKNNSSDAVPLNQAISEKNLSLGSAFNNAKVTLTYPTNTTAVWSGLPSGINGTPIFYFVRENYYTIGTEENAPKYELQSDGTYKNGDDVGSFKPIYTGNGANVNGTVIDVNNSSGLVVEKKWEDLNRNAITPPNEPRTSTPMSIAFTVTGTKSDGTKVVFQLTNASLNAENNYQYPIQFPVKDENNTEYQQSDFVDITVEENLTDVQKNALKGKYKDSPDYTRKIEDGVGKLMIINTKIVNSTKNISVNKIWSDGESSHTNDSITAYLIQSTSELTSAQLKAIETNASDKPTVYTNENMQNGDDVLLIITGKSKTISNVKSVTITDNQIASGSVSNNTLTITGVKSGTTEIIITKIDDSTAEYTISVIDPEVTLSSGKWSAQWSNLPASLTQNDTETTYYYYAIEKTVPTGYTSSYQISGQQTIIRNSKPTKLSVTKKWGTMNQDDQEIYQKSVTAELQYKIGDSGSWTSYTPAKTVTLASDNWTNEFNNLPERDDNNNLYHYRVIEKQVGDSTNLTAFDISYSSEDVTFESASEKSIIITNTLKTVSLNVKKNWVGYEPTATDSVEVNIRRSTDIADVPSVTLIAEETAAETTTTEATPPQETTNAFPYDYTKEISTDKIIKIKFKNNGTTTLDFNGGWGVSPQSEQSADPGSGWTRGKKDDGTDNPWWIQYNWSVSNLAPNAETEIDVPVVVALSNNSQLQLWYVSHGDTETAPITAEISVESSNAFNFSSQGESKTYSDYTPSQVSSLRVHVNHENYKYEYVTINFGNLGNIKAGWYGNNGFQVESSNLSSEISYSPSLSTYTQDGNLTITFNSVSIPNSFTISSSSSDTKGGYVIFNKISPLPRRQVRSVTNVLSKSEETASSNNNDTLLSKMMGGRSGAVSRLMNLKSAKTFQTLNDTIQFFNANSNVTITQSFIKKITITNNNDWVTEISNLPAYDLYGNSYYYWAEEVNPAGFDVSYQFDDGDSSTVYCIMASNPGTGLITIQNKKTESDSGELPEAGGTGTRRYTAVGLSLMALSITIPYIRRKRRNGRKSA